MAQDSDKIDKLISGYCRRESNDMNIIDGIISIIFEYFKSAKWSNKYKGKVISLSDDDSKATCLGAESWDFEGQSVRADICINKGKINSWELECYVVDRYCNFIGVVSSQVEDFDHNPGDRMRNAYGIDDASISVYDGAGSQTDITWSKPEFPLKKIFIINVIADWTEKQCKLTFFYDGEKLNEDIDGYTMLLPVFDDDVVLYPCVVPYNKGAYYIIRYT